jgi:hypothetical protein
MELTDGVYNGLDMGTNYITNSHITYFNSNHKIMNNKCKPNTIAVSGMLTFPQTCFDQSKTVPFPKTHWTHYETHSNSWGAPSTKKKRFWTGEIWPPKFPTEPSLCDLSKTGELQLKLLLL